MRKINFFIAAVLIAFSVQSYPKNISEPDGNISGTWLGTLKVSGIELRLVFNIKENKDGAYTATMDSPDQGAKGIPVDTVILNGKNIRMEVKAVKGYFEGLFNPDSAAISGDWHQSGLSIPITLRKVNKIEEEKRPQEPKPPFPYNAEDISYENKQAGITLAGTLTMPLAGGPFPAVLLITGSGPQNRDEEIFGHKPFLVIADYLTRRGIAVLRVDDRGVGKSTGKFTGSTTKDFSTDALAGVEYLKTVKDVNPHKIGLIGHSEGGLIAPVVADETPDVAFIVLLAGPGLPGNQILLKQEALISRLQGVPEKTVERDTAFKAKLFEIIKQDKDNQKIKSDFEKVINDYYSSLTESEKKDADSADKMLNEFTKALTSPWMEYSIRYNPVPALENVKCPVLALDGSKDMQVPAEEDLAAIKAALEKGGNKNFEVHLLPGLNHLFQDAETGAPSEYGKIEETFSTRALKIMGDWILKIVNEDKK